MNMQAVCRRCAKPLEGLRRNFFGFPEAHCAECKVSTMYPLGGVLVTLYVLALLGIGTSTYFSLRAGRFSFLFIILGAFVAMALMHNFNLSKKFAGKATPSAPLMTKESKEGVMQDQWTSHVARPLFGLFTGLALIKFTFIVLFVIGLLLIVFLQ